TRLMHLPVAKRDDDLLVAIAPDMHTLRRRLPLDAGGADASPAHRLVLAAAAHDALHLAEGHALLDLLVVLHRDSAFAGDQRAGDDGCGSEADEAAGGV